MDSSKPYTATPPLLLSTQAVDGSPELSGIDSPESLLLTMARLTRAYFAFDDLPIDAINTILMRMKGLAWIMQEQLDADNGHSAEDMSHVAWAMEGLVVEAQILLLMWGRHATLDLDETPAQDDGSSVLDDFFG